jgi:hypothetical protein
MLRKLLEAIKIIAVIVILVSIGFYLGALFSFGGALIGAILAAGLAGGLLLSRATQSQRR